MRFKCQIGEGPPLMLVPLPDTPMARKPPPAPPRAVKHARARPRRVPALSRLGAAVLLCAAVGCAAPEPRASKAWTIEPQIGVTHSMQAGDAYYRLGRFHDDTQEWGKAAIAYRKAIAADARNVEAYNALGVALARTGRHAEAEAALRQAVELAPERAHTRSNLGLVLLLAGKRSEALAELNTAVRLDAGDTIARMNLQNALGVHAGDDAAAAAEGPAPASAIAQVAQVAQTAPEPPLARPPRLEISNGNGVPGMAARLGRWLATHEGMRADRLTNQRPFVQLDTVVQYREGYAEAAGRIARSLPVTARAATEPDKGLTSEVRVVLGRDWATSAACLERSGCRPRSGEVKLAHAQPAP